MQYKKIISILLSLVVGVVAVLPANATESDESILVIDSSLEITDSEIAESEPSTLPVSISDDNLSTTLSGEMLLDVEGNGEIYYVDPATKTKEYLADGTAAQLLLKRTALGINEENFAKLIVGVEKSDASVCETNNLGKKLRGKIVLRVGKNGEAYWIYPKNCRAYYAGTHQAAYELMKKFSTGIVKKNLAKVADGDRQRAKSAFRYHVYNYASTNGVSLAEAATAIKSKLVEVRVCVVKIKNADTEAKMTRTEREAAVDGCLAKAGLAPLTKTEREQIREDIKEKREEFKGKKNLREMMIKKREHNDRNVLVKPLRNQDSLDSNY